MAIVVPKLRPLNSLMISPTNLTLIVPGVGVRAVWVRSSVALWLCYGFEDNASLPAVARFPINAGEAWPVEVAGQMASIASQSGVATVNFMGVS